MALYLHEAIRKVLEESGNKPTTIEELADIINQRGLYRKKDGSAIAALNVGLRVVSDISKGTAPIFDVLVRLRRG